MITGSDNQKCSLCRFGPSIARAEPSRTSFANVAACCADYGLITEKESAGCGEAKKAIATVGGFTICSLTPMVTIWGGQFVASTSTW